MKRSFIALYITIILLATVGCRSMDKEDSSVQSPYKLIVDGKEVDCHGYLVIDESNYVTELPVLTIMKALGADIEWLDEESVLITYDGKEYLLDIPNISLSERGEFENYIAPPPGGSADCYEFYGDEFVVGGIAFSYFLKTIHVKLTVDYDNLIVYIESSQGETDDKELQNTKETESPAAPAVFYDWAELKASSNTSNARLIVNGKDITEGNYVYIDFETKSVEVPVLAIIRELGYNPELYHDPKTDVYEATPFDATAPMLTTATDNFGIGPKKGEATCVREFRNDEFICDLDCIYTILYWRFHAAVSVDYENATVEINSHNNW